MSRHHNNGPRPPSNQPSPLSPAGGLDPLEAAKSHGAPPQGGGVNVAAILSGAPSHPPSEPSALDPAPELPVTQAPPPPEEVEPVEQAVREKPVAPVSNVQAAIVTKGGRVMHKGQTLTLYVGKVMRSDQYDSAFMCSAEEQGIRFAHHQL